MKTILFYFHGSPGSSEEFSSVMKHIPFYWARVERNGKILHKSTELQSSKIIVVGYSWGNYHAMEYAINHPKNVIGLVMISPFLSPKTSPFIVAQKIFIRTFFFIIKRPFIQSFVKTTSYPSRVPPDYLVIMEKTISTRSLIEALEEKNVAREKLETLMAAVGEKYPVILIYGQEDKVASSQKLLLAVRSTLLTVKEICVPHGGHALIFTHASLVARRIMNTISFFLI